MAKKQKNTLKNHFQESKLFNNRMVIAAIGIVALLCLVIFRLFDLQIVHHDLYTTLSRQNQFNLIPIEPNRGLIYDRNGVILAENIPVFDLDIIPERVKNFNETVAALQKIIDITPEDIQEFQKALKQNRSYEPIPLKIKLSNAEVARFYVDQYRFPGVEVDAKLMRYYPLGPSMASVMGYVGRINEEDLQNIDLANYRGSNYIGKIGVEKYFEHILHGSVGYQQVEIDANGRIVRSMKRIPTIPGENLYLTIDSNLQMAAQQALGDITGAVVIIQPRTGQVLALVSNPGYDPNLFINGISTADFQNLQNQPGKPLYNRAVRGLFPIGSTIKPYMAIAGLDYGVVTPQYKIHDPGYFQLPGSAHVYHDWRPHGHGIVDVRKAIVVSCDTFMFNLGWRMGITKIATNLDRFGYGKKTDIEMEEELPGLTPTPAWKMRVHGVPWYPGDTVVLSIGQGYIIATPLQMAHAVSIIANRGLNYKPTLVLKMQKPDGTFIKQVPIEGKPVQLSNNAIWDLVFSGMTGVINEPGGTAYYDWQGTPYLAAGKTGTAQVAHSNIIGEPTAAEEARVPYELRNHSFFIAFAPVNNPQIAIAVVAEHSIIPGRVIARKIMDYYMLTEMHGQFNTKTASTSGQGIPTHEHE